MNTFRYVIVEDVEDQNGFGVVQNRTKIRLGRKDREGKLIWENSIWTSPNLGPIEGITLLTQLFDKEDHGIRE